MKEVPRRFAWADWTDEQLLALRMRDLGIKLADSPTLTARVARLYEELGRKGLRRFRPHCWLADEFFAPDGVPGIAIPFYLAHPRLEKLEAKQFLGVEGQSEAECLRILRHEAGHAIDTAYRLHRRKRWRELFGSFTQPYPDTYKPEAGSRDYVVHLDHWYAQAHPAEDWAETFAVWLAPGGRWRQRYADWPALEKLEYVDEWVRQIVDADAPPPVRNRRCPDPLSQNATTLAEHYRRKREHYGDDHPDFYDSDLRKLFSDDPKHAGRPTAASFLRTARPQIREDVARWTGTYPYTIDQVLGEMIARCKQLKLRMTRPAGDTLREAMLMVSVATMNYVLGRGHRVAV